MPPSPQKRPQRGRRSEGVAEDSSPSRPNKRRKRDEEESTEVPEEESSSLLADQSGINMEDDDQVVTRVSQHLAVAQQPCQASKDHANTLHESNKDGVKAYAKIAAQDWTFYITKLVVNIGRSSDPPPQRTEPPENDEDAVHIDLGPSKLVSRQHATVYFNREEEKWWLRVKGRNALKVDGQAWKSGQAGPLTSGEVIEIGGVEMMFVLPIDLGPLHIKDVYLRRAGLLKSEPAAPPARHPLPSGDNHQASPQGKGTRSGTQKPLAPAPPDYKRPGTPPSARARAMAAHKSPYVDGAVMMSTSDVDLSLDENRHIKPQYSYAQMITQAIINTPDEKLNLAGIYNFIMNNYSYYKYQPASGWQNSIRHNLSLNKAFEKVARSTDEPGKGMKWQLVADVRDDMIRTAYRGGRGGHRGSSNPSSPNQLNYITHGPKDMAARDPLSARKRKVSPSGSPQPRSALRESHLTPVRSSRKPLPDEAGFGADNSPLPRLRKPDATTTSALADNAPGSPTLTSSYLQEDGASFVTPAPHRVHPKLAPPSTAQRPSQHMPTSSPAPFWKYADIGSTPLKPVHYDQSPSKALGNLLPQSSSPPHGPSKSPVASPTRAPLAPPLSASASTAPTAAAAASATRPAPEDPASANEPEEEGFDLTKGFQSIGSYHAGASLGQPIQPAANGESTITGDA
ncbi:hypothetical protein GQ53DRAFT_642580 [Thozetella sp. PMI_491]|nr:hypothetical protein GQ53DRAFT_642580 [Thozetella sp. PMI_491]